MLKENMKENLSVSEVDPLAHTLDCGCGLSICMSITYFMLMMSYDSQFQQVSERNLHFVIKMRLDSAMLHI